MINIWRYADANRIRLTDVDGNVYEGDVSCLTEVGERSDLEEQEDGITIWTGGRLIEFMQSEIASIEALDSD